MVEQCDWQDMSACPRISWCRTPVVYTSVCKEERWGEHLHVATVWIASRWALDRPVEQSRLRVDGQRGGQVRMAHVARVGVLVLGAEVHVRGGQQVVRIARRRAVDLTRHLRGRVAIRLPTRTTRHRVSSAPLELLCERPLFGPQLVNASTSTQLRRPEMRSAHHEPKVLPASERSAKARVRSGMPARTQSIRMPPSVKNAGSRRSRAASLRLHLPGCCLLNKSSRS